MNEKPSKEHPEEEMKVLYAESMIVPERREMVPEEILHHIDSCISCKKEILDLHAIIKGEKETISQIKEMSGIKVNSKIVSIFSKITNSPNIYRIAAVFVLVAASFLVVLNLQSGSDYNKLYQSNFEAYPDVVSMKGSTNLDKGFEMGLVYYNREVYDTASKLFKVYLNEYPENEMAKFYLAISEMELERFSNAKMLFEEILKGSVSDIRNASEWYLALCLLKTNDEEYLKEVLMSIKQKNNSYSERAANILSEIS